MGTGIDTNGLIELAVQNLNKVLEIISEISIKLKGEKQLWL